MIHLITGHAGAPHVTSDDQRHQNAITLGSGSYLVSGCECTIAPNNKAHIADGELLINGAYVRITGGGEDVQLESGAVGETRIDYVVIRYEVASSGIESVSIVAKRGTAQPPTVQAGSILEGAGIVEVPLYRLDFNGVNVTVGEKLIPDFNATEVFGLGALAFKNAIAAGDITSGTINNNRLPTTTIAKGGTGATTAADARTNLGLGTGATISPVDYITAKGDSGGWTYIKWNSGIAMCFKDHSYTAGNGNQAVTVTLPFNLIATKNRAANANGGVPSGATSTVNHVEIISANQVKIWFYNSTGASATCHMYISAFGYWK